MWHKVPQKSSTFPSLGEANYSVIDACTAWHCPAEAYVSCFGDIDRHAQSLFQYTNWKNNPRYTIKSSIWVDVLGLEGLEILLFLVKVALLRQGFAMSLYKRGIVRDSNWQFGPSS